MDLLIKGGNALLPSGIEAIDIAIQNGQISAIGDLSGKYEPKKVIDATGLYILPGIIDSQVHFREPGATHKEDLTTGSRSALLGGVTTFLEMPNTNPSTTSKEALLHKVEIAKKNCVTNFGFFMGATAHNLNELKNSHEIPYCCGIKIFLGSSTGDLLLYEEKKLEEIFTQTKGVIALHSENEEMLKANISIRDNATSAHAHPQWRSVEVCLSSTKRLIEIAKRCNRKVHVLHISTQEEIEFLEDHKDICTVEVLPQHLTLNAPDCYDKLGTYAQMNPPIREKRHQDALWRGIKNGTVDIVGSDHAPHTKEEKDKGYPHSPSGMPGVQTMLPIMLDHVNNGRLSLEHMSRLLSSNPAKLYGLNKGRIELGFDGDLTIVDLKKEVTLTNEIMATKSAWTPYNGIKVKGYPTHTIISGIAHQI